MSVPKIMLLTHVFPSRVGVGGLYLRQLCNMYPRDRICCFHTDKNNVDGSDLAWLQSLYHHPPNELGHETSYRLWRMSHSVKDWITEELAVPRVLEQAVAYGRKNQVDLVWAFLFSPTCIRIATPLAESLRVPLITTVTDPPDYVMNHIYHRNSFANWQTTRQFTKTMHSVLRCGVASDGMKLSYEAKYGTDCITMIYSPTRLPEINRLAHSNQRDYYIIGYAGWVYCLEEWHELLKALARSDWKINGRKVIIRVMGQGFRQDMRIPMNVELLGWRDPIDTQRLLAECDAAYLPYWMHDDFQEPVRLSFPNKLAAYVAARVPVMYHGPRESSVSAFFEHFPVGLGCYSNDNSEIISTLQRILTDPEIQMKSREACDDAYSAELGPNIFRHKFATLVGIEDKLLLSSEQIDIHIDNLLPTVQSFY